MFIPRNVKTRTANTNDPRHVPGLISERLNSPACEVLAAAEELTTATRIVTQRASLWAALATFAARLGCALSSAAVAWATANDTDDEALLALTSCAVTLGATTVRPIAAAFKRSKDRLVEHNLRLVVHCAEPDKARVAFARHQAVANGVMLARDLVNEPANVLGTLEFAARAKELEALGVKTDRGHIVTDGYGATGVPGLWAIGDVTGPPWLAHKASHEGVIAVEKMAGVAGVHPLDSGNIPGCTYSRPQVASVGMTEAKAIAAGHAVKVGKFPCQGNGKAIALGEAEGFVKTVFDAATGELLGAHMVGAEVTELIQGYVVARQLETTEVELQHAVFPHPTLSEMMHESVLDAYGRALHY